MSWLFLFNYSNKIYKPFFVQFAEILLFGSELFFVTVHFCGQLKINKSYILWQTIQ
jgi:hypothetical protein